MSITSKKPPLKETVGAQYICFNTATEDGDWTKTFEENVEKTETVKSVKVTENGESTPVHASGKVYDTDETISGVDIEVENVAFVAETLAKMRGDIVDTGGLVLSGGKGIRPYFAYGKVVIMRGGKVRYEWYPKCKLAENSDNANTSEEKFSEQTDTVTIKAYPFNENKDIKAMVDSTMASFPVGLTEEKFFAKPILTKEDLKTATGVGG